MSKPLGKVLRKARRSAGLTQALVAMRLGIDRTTYVRVELGQIPITVDRLRRLARILRTDAGALLSE